MHRLPLILWLSFISFQSEGMFAQGGCMPKPTVDFYYAADTAVLLHPVTVKTFKQDADNLYISIDDFRVPQKKRMNEISYTGFIGKYLFCVVTNQEYKSALADHIIPDYKKFVEEDAACETAGIYSDEEVKAYVDFLRERLNWLRTLSFLGLLVNNQGE
ncbi:MAG: hypothetical protein IJ730_00385 [Alphaproteobacteria bacterium]|nr:hypothetical protein [Alphaproteobacteria bacterium]